MSGITSSVGLISGLPTADLINQLMAIEARPMNLVQDQVSQIQTQRTAFADLSAQLLGLRTAVRKLGEASFFQAFKATSSNSDVLTARAGQFAIPGTYSFQVHSLVATHSMIGRGFADRSTTAVGAGQMTLEGGKGLVADSTSLDLLNGGAGVRRGKIEITDRAGQSAQIDLTAALTVNDVLEAINDATGINVQAKVVNDTLVIEDLNETATGQLTIGDLGHGHAAEDLGLAQTVAGAELISHDLMNLSDTTPLAWLNDGNGVGKARSGADFIIQQADGTSFEISLSSEVLKESTRLEVLNNGNGVRLGTIEVTDRQGRSVEVDLSGTQDIGEVIEAIDTQATAAGLDLDITIINSTAKNYLLISDNSSGEGALTIKDVDGYAARDLGIAGEGEEGSIDGNNIYKITTVGDVMRAIQYAMDNNGEYNEGRIRVDFADNGNRLVLSSLGTPRDFEVIAGVDAAGRVSTAAEDLGLLGNYAGGVQADEDSRDLIAGLNTVLLHSLNGGSGVELGTIRLTARDGTTTEIDLTGAQTLAQVIDRINAASGSSKITATINQAGHGFKLIDQSGGTANSLIVEDVTGTAAAELHLAGEYAAADADSGNLQRQYISANTLLSDLNHGQGVSSGELRITDKTGAVHVINLTENYRTVGDVLYLINTATDNVQAEINTTGDGIVIKDLTGGEGTLSVAEGTTASDLNLVGTADKDEDQIDGSFEVRIDIDADDTLEDVAAKINEATGDARAVVINDGSQGTPYRLTVTSTVSGLAGG